MDVRKYRLIGPFTLAYTLGFGAFVLIRGNHEFIFYGVVMAFLIALVLVLDRVVNFSKPVLWGLAIWGLLHMAGGNVPIPERLADVDGKPVLYSLWLVPGLLKFDQVVHAFGFFVTTFVCHQALRRSLARPETVGAGLAFLLAATSMGFGAMNEVVEFVATLLIPDTNVGGYENTGWDLIANMTGALLAASLLWMQRRLKGHPVNLD